MIKQTMLVLAGFACVAPALAINKCTGVDGKVTYQESSCPTDGKAKADEVKTWAPSGKAAESWRFSRERDPMTGTVACFAVSPSVAVPTAKAYVYTHLQIVFSGPQIGLTVRLSPSGTDLFHNRVSGMGMTVGKSGFVPAARSGQHTVAFSSDDQELLVAHMRNGGQGRMRLRFWPWDPLNDSDPVPTNGFKQAYASAEACSRG